MFQTILGFDAPGKRYREWHSLLLNIKASLSSSESQSNKYDDIMRDD
jgi:hypothetical protein